MDPIASLNTRESPRQILAEDFRSIGELPIRGGWGYTQADACIIDKNDPIVNPVLPFDGVAIEYVFVEKRIYEELIVFRPEGQKHSGIRWKCLEAKIASEGDRVFDNLTFEVTAFRDSDWDSLRAEWEGPDGHENSAFDVAAHEARRQEKLLRLTREFWFDITSFYGK
jgi:hypothetical protein